MTEDIRFDDRRSAAWREAIVKTAREGRATNGGNRNRKRVALVVGLICAALVLSGGGVAYAFSAHLLTPAAAPASTPATATSPTPTQDATPTTTPTPTSTTPVAQANVPDDPSTWIIDFSGVGPATLGSSLTEDATVFPRFQDVTDDLCRPRQLDLTNPEKIHLGLFGTAAEPTVAGTIVLNARVFAGEQVPPTPRNAEGIGLGSTLDQLRTAYPVIERTGGYGTDGQSEFYGMSDQKGVWMVFEVSNGTVNRIQLGPDKTMPSEYCPA